MPKKNRPPDKLDGDAVKAIIPAAGMGTRMRPLSLAVPKEMFPVNKKPMIQIAVEEAIFAGIMEIGIVIRKGKEIIKHYFERLMELNEFPMVKNSSVAEKVNLHFIFQKEPLGLGNAVYSAADFIRDSSFVMVIPDQFLISEVPAIVQLLNAAQRQLDAVWSSIVQVCRMEFKFFQGARAFLLTDRVGRVWKVAGFQNTIKDAGNLIDLGFGRTYFPAGGMDYFSEQYLNPASGEVDLLPTFKALLKSIPNYAVLLDGRPIDLGTWVGYEHFSDQGEY